MVFSSLLILHLRNSLFYLLILNINSFEAEALRQHTLDSKCLDLNACFITHCGTWESDSTSNPSRPVSSYDKWRTLLLNRVVKNEWHYHRYYPKISAWTTQCNHLLIITTSKTWRWLPERKKNNPHGYVVFWVQTVWCWIHKLHY